MRTTTADILVVGAGPAGLIAALAFAGTGHTVTCVDPGPSPDQITSPDLRSTAFLMPSIRLLREIGAWDSLEAVAAPLETMRIVDAAGKNQMERERVDFCAHEAGEHVFGWNVPNAPLKARLGALVQAHGRITMRFGTAVSNLMTRTNEALITLDDTSRVRAKLVIAADGRHSTVRDLCGIDVTTLRYGQKALVFQVHHAMAHHSISTEVHRSGGPFTLVPLAGDDQSHSAVVWMTDGPEAMRLTELPKGQFEEAMNHRAAGVMGRLTLTSDRALWPIISQFAERLSDERIALVGEAAHVVPPIGAQGLNMSLADIACLRSLITEQTVHGDPGSAALFGDV